MLSKYAWVLGAIALTTLVGCYEDTHVTEFEPGVYKGAPDPLLSASADERGEVLAKRFGEGQTDR